MLANKRKKRTDSKITLKELVWLGFCFTASGVTFTSSFGGIVSSSKNGIGWWIFLVIILGSILIGSTAWAFKKCSEYYKSDTNGGAYIYVRSTFGRFWGWIIGFVQYVTLPTSVIVSIIALVDQDIGYLIPNSVPLIGNNQEYQHLYLNIIGILIFFISSFIIYFGLKILKTSVNISSFFQWSSSFIIIGCALYLFIQNGFANFTSHSEIHNKINHFNLSNFNNSEVQFIYFFVGFETFACIGKNLKNPEKNIGKAIMMVLLAVTIFYLVVTFIFIGAVGIDSFRNNSTQTGIINGKNPSLFVASKTLQLTGIIIIVVSVFTTKLNSIIQSSLYSGTMLEPLAIEGYISPKITKMHKQNIPFRASMVNTLITIISSIIILIIPNLFKSDIDFSAAIGFSSLFSVIIYISVVLVSLKLSWNKKIKLKIWELIIIFVAFISLTWLAISYFVSLFVQIYQGTSVIINIAQIVLLFILLLFAIAWYFAYYNPIYKKRLLENPELHLKIEAQFNINNQYKN